MSNMLFKTNLNLFVRNYNFNLPRKIDWIILSIFNWTQDPRSRKTNGSFFRCTYFTFLKNGYLSKPKKRTSCLNALRSQVVLALHYQGYRIKCATLVQIDQFWYIFGFSGKLFVISILIYSYPRKIITKFHWLALVSGRRHVSYLYWIFWKRVSNHKSLNIWTIFKILR